MRRIFMTIIYQHLQFNYVLRTIFMNVVDVSLSLAAPLILLLIELYHIRRIFMTIIYQHIDNLIMCCAQFA